MYVRNQPFRPEVTYDETLRALGKFIDEHGGSHVVVQAVTSGFEVSYHTDSQASTPTCRILRHDQLAARARGPHTSERRLRSTDAQTGVTYENLFRSIGRELQESAAQLLTLEETVDGFLLTYQHHGRASGTILQTRQVMINRDDAQSFLVAGSHLRRQRPVRIGPRPARSEQSSTST